MFEKSLQGVERPGRYVGGEINACGKSFEDARVRFALAFPDVYEVGLSHLGLRLLYHLLNGMEGVMADRVYAPWFDFERRLREEGEPLRALESRRNLKDFDFLGFSLQYELGYTNILTILDLAKIPFRADARSMDDPWIVGGGPCAFNPEPLAPFFDFFVLGEAEELLRELVEVYGKWKEEGAGREVFLERICRMEGVYVPSFFQVHYGDDGTISSMRALREDHRSIGKRLVMDLDACSPLPEKPLVPLLDIVHNRLGMEIARGCTRGCRFCQAGFIYRPVRERNPVRVVREAKRALENTGYEELSLLSLSTGDYCHIQSLLAELMGRFGEEKVAVSFPSMRVGTLTPELMGLIQKVRKTGFTLAPEAGSERLRRVINKEILDEDLLAAAQSAYGLGWRVLKLYFMIGLPTERLEDLEAMVALCHKVWELGKGSRAAVNVSVSTFIPKAMTPFQWEAQMPREEVEERLEYLRAHLKKPGMRFKWHHPGHSHLEGVFARGDRRLAPVIERAWRMGARFDGWTECLREDLWKQAFHHEGIDPSFYTCRERSKDEVLPWDHLSAGVDKEYFLREKARGLEEEFTSDCRWSACTGCGVCDHEEIRPLLHHEASMEFHDEESPGKAFLSHVPDGVLYRLHYSKIGTIRFVGQIELAQALMRAVRRAGLSAAYSRGFHPHMKLSFPEALPLGMESEVSEAYLTLTRRENPQDIRERLNAHLPEGVEITSVSQVARRARKKGPQRVTYLIEGLGFERVRKVMKEWPSRSEDFLEKKTKKGKLTAPLHRVLLALRLMDESSLEMDLVEMEQACFRPMNVLEHLLQEPPDSFGECRVRKVAVWQLSEGEGEEDVGRAHHQC